MQPLPLCLLSKLKAAAAQNQVTGHEFLRRTGLLDECPQPGRCIRFGWQIDMFAGFSGATPNLWAMAGYDGMFLRWEGTDAQNASFIANQGYEWLWESSASLSANRSRIFAHSMFHNYGDLAGFHGTTAEATAAGVGFDWDDGGSAAPVNSSNVGHFAAALKEFVQQRKPVFQGPILAVWGSDYRFMNASLMYGNMKKIHAEVNAHPQKYGMRIRFTTLAQYADHLNSLRLKFPVHRWPTDFEYGWPHVIPVPLDGPPVPPSGTPLVPNRTVQYQTGAPVSRAAFKQRARQVSAIHHAAEVAHALAVARGKMAAVETELFPAWDALGIVQHHDAMPGTMSTKGTFTSWGTNGQDQAPKHAGNVACGVGSRYHDTDCLALEDYFKRLSEGWNASASVLGRALAALHGTDAGTASYSFEQQGASSQLTVFNPLARSRMAVIEAELPAALQVGRTATPPEVKGPGGKAVEAQMSTDGKSLFFKVSMAPLASLSFTLAAASGSSATKWPTVTAAAPKQPLKNSALEVAFTSDGTLKSITHTADSVSVAAQQQYFAYETNQGGPYTRALSELEISGLQSRTTVLVAGCTCGAWNVVS